MRNLSLIITLIISSNVLLTQNNQTSFTNKGSFFVYWGYNRSWFSKSDIHFKAPEYDFVVKNASASDRPSPFELDVYLNPVKLSIPQFNVRAGFFITEKLSVSLGYDHMKYVFNSNQTAIIDGTVSSDISTKYQGDYHDVEMVVPYDFVFFEHTDGLNFLTSDLEYAHHITYFANKRFNVEANLGIGGGVVIPRTDALLFNKRGLNNRFHLAGYGFNYKLGLRTNYKNKLFLLIETRQGYINLPDILIENDRPDRAHHSFMFYEFYVTLGYKFKLFKSK